MNPILMTILFALMVAGFAGFMLSFIRAAQFASLHKETMTTSQKVSWWIRLAKPGSYGPGTEPERQRLFRHLLLSGTAMFAAMGILYATSPAV